MTKTEASKSYCGIDEIRAKVTANGRYVACLPKGRAKRVVGLLLGDDYGASLIARLGNGDELWAITGEPEPMPLRAKLCTPATIEQTARLAATGSAQ